MLLLLFMAIIVDMYDMVFQIKRTKNRHFYKSAMQGWYGMYDDLITYFPSPRVREEDQVSPDTA
jgi:hypothetical protein